MFIVDTYSLVGSIYISLRVGAVNIYKPIKPPQNCTITTVRARNMHVCISCGMVYNTTYALIRNINVR